MAKQAIQEIIGAQRKFFNFGASREVSFQLRQLTLLKEALSRYESEIIWATAQDLGQPETEAYNAEIATVLFEIEVAIKQLSAWARPKRVPTSLLLFPATSWIYSEPYGSVLIIGPWNHPFQLLLSPLVGALAAGYSVVVKPSEMAPNCSQVIADMIGEFFDPQSVTVFQGGVSETQELLAQRFDYILFTGSPRVGQIVMEAAARHLTPLTLELGGKNPCIVDSLADLEKAARRIVWGKFVTAGQNCIAPDYLLVHKSTKAPLLEFIRTTIGKFFGENPANNPDYGRIINAQHFARLTQLMQDSDVVIGGKVVAEERYISPTVIDNVTWEHPVMQEEIFGPILPILEYENLDEVIGLLQTKPKPLGLYFVSYDRERQEKVLQQLPSGGACINDTFSQILNQRLPFGGVGNSGMGAYHGKAGFDTFTHYKSVVKRATWLDPGYRYPPYSLPLAFLKRMVKFLL